LLHSATRHSTAQSSGPALADGVITARLARQQFDAVGLDHGVERKRSAGLALAPAAVAAMHEERPRRHAIAHLATGAAAFVGLGLAGHGARLPAKFADEIASDRGREKWPDV
jgi:hypothetical protein